MKDVERLQRRSLRGFLALSASMATSWILFSELVRRATGHGPAGLLTGDVRTGVALGSVAIGLFLGAYAIGGLVGDRCKVRDLSPSSLTGSSGVGLIWGAVCMGLVFGAQTFLGHISGWTLGSIDHLASDVIVLYGAALAEELIFRGVLFDYAQRWLGRTPALILSALVFTLAHVDNPGLGPLAFLTIMTGGIALALAFEMTGSIWACAAAHYAWNLMLGPILGAPLSGRAMQSLFKPVLPHGAGPLGGAFGLENTLPGLIVLSGATGLLFWLKRRSTKRP